LSTIWDWVYKTVGSSSEYGNSAILDATIILPLDNRTDLITDTDVTQDILSEMDINQQTDHDFI